MARRPDRPPIGSTRVGRASRVGRAAGTSGGPGSRADGSTPSFTRPALAPGLLATVVLLACIALVGSGPFVFVRWGITVLALIVLVFAVRGRSWVSVAISAAVVICWNPVLEIPIPGQVWAAMQILAAAAFIAVGIVVKVPREDG